MKEINLKNDAKIIFNENKGAIKDIFYKGQHLVNEEIAVFCIKLRDKNGNKKMIFATDFEYLKNEGNTYFYSHKLLDVKLFLTSNQNSLIWKIEVNNKMNDLLEWVELMAFGVSNKLCDEENGKGEIVFPYNEGCRVTNMAYRESMPFRYIEPDYPSKNSYQIFPNMISSQFISYICNGVGIYLAMLDTERTPKHIDFCYHNNSIKVFMRTFCNCNYGENYSMPFESVMTIFDGNWQDACELYRNWFYNNLPKGLTKIIDNKKLPKWYEDSPLVVAYPVVGKKDTEIIDNGCFPYENAMPMLEDISKNTDSKVMALLMHWEGTAPWAPPYMWPPRGGEKMFNDFVKKAHSKDMLVGLYASGLGYSLQSNIDKDYNKEKDFEKDKIKDIVCTNSNGEIDSIICTAQRKGYDLCPSCEKTQQIFKDEIEKIVSNDVDYMQALDQNHGGGSYFCYSDKHNHIPAPGKWQVKEVSNLLHSIDRKNMLLGSESASAEPFINELNFSDNRFQLNFYNGQAIPIYAYIYHEFVNNFMGNQICSMLAKTENNFTYRLAYSFTCGDMLTVTMVGNDMKYSWCDWILPQEKNVDKDVAFKFIKILNSWRKNGCKNYLHYGKMIKGIDYECSNQKFLCEDGKTYLVQKSVLSSAFSFNSEKAQFFVNYNLQPITIKLNEKVDAYLEPTLKKVEKNISEITIQPLSVVMIKL